MKTKTRKSTKDKKKQLSLTNQWLDDNYCVCEGVCIPRCILYSHYLDFCHNNHLSAACAATFGKIIRQKFPNITTRRLGTRGHSKYHYYGICIRETSQYYHTLYSGGGLTRFSGSKFKSDGGFTRKYSLTSKTGSALPEFPSSYGLNLPQSISTARLETLLMMYHTHCQCILDTVISSRFVEIPTYLMHFWQGVPEHLVPLFEHHIVINVLAYCDTILYTSLLDVLIPATMQEVPDQLLVEVQNLVRCWEVWMSHSLSNLQPQLIQSKMSVAQQFVQALKRQAAFIHLAQMVRPILYDCQMVNQMCSDVNSIQMEPAPQQADDTAVEILETELLVQLKEVLHKQATVEAFTEWLDATLTQRVVKPCGGNSKMFRKKAHSFLLVWSRFGAQLMQLLNDKAAVSLTSVNLIRLLLDEYVLVAVECQLQEDTNQQLLSEIQRYMISPTPDIPGLNTIEMQKMYAFEGNNGLNQQVSSSAAIRQSYSSCYQNTEASTGIPPAHAQSSPPTVPVPASTSPSQGQSSCRYNNHTQWWNNSQHMPTHTYPAVPAHIHYYSQTGADNNMTYTPTYGTYQYHHVSQLHYDTYGASVAAYPSSLQPKETNQYLPSIYQAFN